MRHPAAKFVRFGSWSWKNAAMGLAGGPAAIKGHGGGRQHGVERVEHRSGLVRARLLSSLLVLSFVASSLAFFAHPPGAHADA